MLRPVIHYLFKHANLGKLATSYGAAETSQASLMRMLSDSEAVHASQRAAMRCRAVARPVYPGTGYSMGVSPEPLEDLLQEEYERRRHEI